MYSIWEMCYCGSRWVSGVGNIADRHLITVSLLRKLVVLYDDSYALTVHPWKRQKEIVCKINVALVGFKKLEIEVPKDRSEAKVQLCLRKTRYNISGCNTCRIDRSGVTLHSSGCDAYGKLT